LALDGAGDSVLEIGRLQRFALHSLVVIVIEVEVDGFLELIGRLRSVRSGDRAVGIEIESRRHGAIAGVGLLVGEAVGIGEIAGQHLANFGRGLKCGVEANAMTTYSNRLLSLTMSSTDVAAAIALS